MKTFDEVTRAAPRATEMAQADALADVTAAVLDVLSRFSCECEKPPCIDIPFLTDMDDEAVADWIERSQQPCANGMAVLHAAMLKRSLDDIAGTGAVDRVPTTEEVPS